jgi:hypothetical protein
VKDDGKIRLDRPFSHQGLSLGDQAEGGGKFGCARPKAITWEEFFDSHSEDSAGQFLTEIFHQLVIILRRCPLEVQEVFLHELVEMVQGETDAEEPDA